MIRPFSTHRPTEIVAAPKVYGFDTGFGCYHRGWTRLRAEDMGLLREHFVLSEVQASRQICELRFSRDKRGHEIGFVVTPRGEPPLAIECKWSAGKSDPSSLLSFRRQYPEGENLVVAQEVDRAYRRNHAGVGVRYVPLEIPIQDLRDPSNPDGRTPAQAGLVRDPNGEPRGRVLR